MVAHYNPETNKVKLISFMRDMYVSIPDHRQQKLNAAYTLGGPDLLRETIKENFGLDIHYYATIDFQGFEKAVDLLAPNGIEVDVPYEMTAGIGMTLEKGTQVLHGEELLGYVRFRQDRLSDFGRVQRQQEVISKLKEEAVSMNSIANLPDLLRSFTYIRRYKYRYLYPLENRKRSINGEYVMKSNHYGFQKMVVLRMNDMMELEKC